MNFSRLRGGIIEALRWVFTDHSFSRGGEIFVLIWLGQNCHGDTGVEIFPKGNANNITVHYN